MPFAVSGGVPPLEQLGSLSESSRCSLVGALQHHTNILQLRC